MFDNRRKNSSSWTKAPPTIAQNQIYDHYATQQYSRPPTEHMYLQTEPLVANGQAGNLSVLTDNITRMNLQPGTFQPSAKPSPAMSSQSFDGGVPLSAGLPQAYMHNGQFVFAGSQYPNIAQQTMNYGYGMPGQYITQPMMYPQHVLGSHSPLSSAWAPSSRVPSGEVPSLVTPRRDSTSSQENDVPGTPFTHYTSGYGGYPSSVAVVDRSPNSLYTPIWSTPSPTQTGYKHQQRSSISTRLQLLVQQEPAIPRAVPAPYSPVKPLDRSLENPHGITNVYIRGLLPETTDDMLYKLAGRFGDVVSSKSIIDHATGLCKG